MSMTIFALTTATALALLAVSLNHLYARLAMVELSLNEGLPPGFEPQSYSQRANLQVGSADLDSELGTGVHVFLSRSCLACQRLISDLGAVALAVDAPLHLHYVDRPRPEARRAAEHNNAELHIGQLGLSQRVGADPLPFTVAVGAYGLASRAVTPTIDQLLVVALDAGIDARTDTP